MSPFPPFAPFKPDAQTLAFTTAVLQFRAVFAQNFKFGITQSWNALGRTWNSARIWFSDLAYVGSESDHQADVIDQNPGVLCQRQRLAVHTRTSSRFSPTSARTPPATTRLQVGVERHLTKGLQFQSNFTWSKTIDTDLFRERFLRDSPIFPTLQFRPLTVVSPTLTCTRLYG